MVKQLRQVVGVDSVKVVDFKRGVFSVTPQRGVRLSESALLAAARRSGFQPDRVVPTGAAAGEKSRFPALTKEDNAAGNVAPELTPARQAFREGQYQNALRLVRETPAKSVGDDAAGDEPEAARRNAHIGELQQLRSLIEFALGRYEDAAAAAHAGLPHAEPWDWKTMSGHYAKTTDYTLHLRALENSIRKESTPEKRFLIGYHYLMLGQPRAAHAQFARVAQANPGDELVAKLLRDLEKEKSND